MTVEKADVIIVGGGPSGLFLACRLALLKIKAIVLEKDETPQPAVRAIGYYAATQFALKKAGLFETAAKRGYFQVGFSWRKATQQVAPDEKDWGDLIAAWNPWQDSELKLGDCGYGMLTFGQDQLRELCLEHLEGSKYVQVYVGHPVVDLVQRADTVTVTALAPNGDSQQFTASYVVGSDGGQSVTRKLIGQKMEGYTWPHTAVGVDLLVNLPPPTDGPGLVYLLDKENMGFFCPLEEPKKDSPIMYRFTFPLPPEQCDDAVFDYYVRKKVEFYVPGKRPLEYKIVRAGKYAVHQRQVADYLVGRVVLIGDAAHLNSPTGGLALTAGLLDADSLADAFELIFHEQNNPSSILRVWADARHAVWKNIVNPMSEQNTRRVQYTDPENPKADSFLKMIMENDPKIKTLNDTFNDDLITDVKTLVATQALPNGSKNGYDSDSIPVNKTV